MGVEEQFHRLACSLPIGIYRVDKEGNCIYVNDKWCETAGMTFKEAEGDGWIKALHPEDSDRVVKEWKDAVENGKPFKSEYRLKRSDGGITWVSGKATVEKGDDGAVVGYIGTVVDITDHRMAEEKLRKSESKLEKAQEIAHIGSWDWNIVTKELYWSDEIYRVIGFKPQEFGATYDAFMESVHPEDRKLVQEAVNKALNDKEPYNIVHRVIRPDGMERIVNERGEATFDASGKPVMMIGAMQDITERKLAEDQLQLAKKILDRAIEGVMISDSDSIIISVNSAFTDITGYSAEEVIGKSPRILRSDRHDKEFYQKMWKNLLESGSWEGEIWNRRKSGEAYLEWLSITAIKDEHDRIVRYAAVFHDITDARRSEEQVKHQAFHDILTGLPNRFLFNDRLALALVHAESKGTKVAVLSAGLDRFSNINESLGPVRGDSLLQEVAERFKGCMKDGDTVSRFGGDEFTFVLENIDSEQEAVRMAHDIIKSLSTPFPLEMHEIYITVGIGITLYPDDGKNAESLIVNADAAMKKAKQHGKNSYQLFTSEMDIRSLKHLELERDLRNALKQGELTVYYQPKVELKSNRITGMEALVRWEKPGKGIISPGEFIPLAEETGLIIPLSELVLKKACLQNKIWQDEGYDKMRVAVNLSALQFRKKELVDTIQSVLEETGLDPNYLEIEITESIIMGDVEEAIEIMQSLRDMGISLTIDDFGTGYSSLNYLKRFPVNVLKIDKSFVDDITSNPADVAIAKTIISMSHHLKMKVVAEGVETEEQLELLRNLECDEIQGYIFSRPLPAEPFAKFLGEMNKP